MTASANSRPVNPLESFDQHLEQALNCFMAKTADSLVQAQSSLREAVRLFRKIFLVQDNSGEQNLIKARCLVRLMDVSGSLGQISDARQLLPELTGLTMSAQIKSEAARAVLNLATDYAAAGDVLEAQSLYDSVGRAGLNPGLAFEKNLAALSLAAAQVSAGNPIKALSLIKSLNPVPEPSQELRLPYLVYAASFLRALNRASSNEERLEGERIYRSVNKNLPPIGVYEQRLTRLIRLYKAQLETKCGNLHLAQAILDSDWSAESDENILAATSETLACMVAGHLRNSHPIEAKAAYDKLLSLGDSPEILTFQAKGTSAYIEHYLNSQKLGQALDLFREMAHWPNPASSVPLRAWTAQPIISYMAEKGFFTQAAEVFRELAGCLGRPELAGSGGSPEPPEASQLIVALGFSAVQFLHYALAADQMDIARNFFNNLSALGDLRAAQEVRAMAASLLVAAYTAKDLLNEAISVFRTIPKTGPSEGIQTARVLASDILTHRYAMIFSEDHKPNHEKPPSPLAGTWKSLILRWLGEQLKDFKKAQGQNNLPSLW
ncbi:MAG: hypothetical protein LBP22_13465 [Deltaproteobacteria bacterium]|jgi:hypothetical protein|nr:hypothetical protein [Deltaproteobacteria bacterium]